MEVVVTRTHNLCFRAEIRKIIFTPYTPVLLYEPRMRKQRRRATAKLISAFVFATRIVQFLSFLNPKFQASSHLLWLHSPVCVAPGRKPRRQVFSQRGSYKRGSKLHSCVSMMGNHSIPSFEPGVYG